MANIKDKLLNTIKKISKDKKDNLIGKIVEEPLYKRLPENTTTLTASFEPHVIKKNRKGGEKDLVYIANEIPYEVAWRYNCENSEWYNVGISSSENISIDGLIIFESVISYKLKDLEYPNIILYHTHPKKFSEISAKRRYDNYIEMIKEQGKENEFNQKRLERTKKFNLFYYDCVSSLPSTEDIKTCAILQTQRETFFGYSSGFHMGIASKIGITIATIDGDLSTFCSIIKTYNPIDSNLWKRVSSITKELSNNFNNPLDYQTVNNRLFKSINEEIKGLKLEFFPIE
ncbi:MAG: hypothetical protein ISS23_02360 [Nanoarchaeota archaeon]|nr:hypothetical protein [Nanoarchaeota archaeon]